MATSAPAFILVTLTNMLFLLPSTLSQSTMAPAPGPSGPINITAILVAGRHFSSFLRLLNQTQVLDQLTNQLNNSNQGMTLFAPTDNAFLNLPSGTINNLSEEKKVKLVLYHVLPKYYSIGDLDTISNPVPTQLGGDHGSVGLNFSGRANQVNVSTGVVETQISNALSKDFPIAIHVVDAVLIPLKFTKAQTLERSSFPTEEKHAKAPSSPAASPTSKEKHAKAPSSPAASSPLEEKHAKAPSSSSAASPPEGKPAKAPISSEAYENRSSPAKNRGGRRVDIEVGLAGGVVLFCMAFL